jgi:NADPH-dependent curcumin reductase CurA
MGIAGSDDKCAWLKNELEFDIALNYKSPNFKADFYAATEEHKIDVFFDNVGGEILDLCLDRANPHARFVMCGAVSGYNNVTKIPGPKNFLNIVKLRLRVEGFIVMDHMDRIPEARKALGEWLAAGKIKSKLTLIKGGLEEADKALVGMYEGVNMGKLVVEVAKDARATNA